MDSEQFIIECNNVEIGTGEIGTGETGFAIASKREMF